VLVVVDRGGNIYSLDPETGEVLKPSPSIIEKRVLANPIEFDGDVLVVSQDGDLYRVKPTGDEAPRRIEVKQ
jgi:outer membrane protein assembly factor BamB